MLIGQKANSATILKGMKTSKIAFKHSNEQEDLDQMQKK